MKNLLFVLLSASISIPAVSQTINPTGSFSVPRWKHESVLLNNGKVLVFGGNNGAITPTAYNSAEIYTPAAGAWNTTGNMIEQRYEMASALLPNGNVIAIGGQFGNFYGSMTSEIYNVTTGTWSKADSMDRVRYGHRAVVLPNGNILIAGGLPATNTAEIYNPTTNSWTYTGNMNVTRNEGISLTLLNNGKVLAAGGNSSTGLNTAEIYDPSTGTWTNVPGNMSGKRYWHSAILLNNGKVLLAGSSDFSNNDDKTTELYNPVTNSFSPSGSLQHSRINNATVKLNNGDVLIYGWGDNASPSNTKCIEVYSNVSGTWTTSQMYNIVGTIGYSINKLPNGKVLVAGGLGLGTGGATDLSKLINDNTISGINDYNHQVNLNIYPNPTSEFLYLDIDELQAKDLYFTLSDAAGRQVLSSNIQSVNTIFNISHLVNGIYFYNLSHNGKSLSSGKLIIY